MNEIFEDDYIGDWKKDDAMDKILDRMGDTPAPQRNYSKRAEDWLNFAMEVFDHIEKYCVPQYGDRGTDQCTEFTQADFVTQMKKYLNRMGRNSRPGQDKLDLLKVAHYAQMASLLLNEE